MGTIIPNPPVENEDPWFTTRDAFDSAVKTRLNDELSDAQLNAMIAGAALTARAGHEFVFLACVIRNDGPGFAWDVLPISTNHRPVNIDSVEQIGSGIRINYASLGAASTVIGLVGPDETLARAGMIVGPSVTEDHMDIYFSQVAREVSDYVYYNGTTWVSQNGAFSGIALSPGGQLSLTHEAIPIKSIYSVGIEERGPRYIARVSTAVGSDITGQTSLKLDIREAGSVADQIWYDGTNWVSDKGQVTVTFNAGVVTVTHASVGGLHAVSVTPRTDAYRVNVPSAAGAVSNTVLKFEVRDASTGALVTTPNTGMRFFVSHGMGQEVAAGTPTTDMKFYISHGGGQRAINAADVTTAEYPFSNFWVWIVLEMPTA